MSLSNIVLVFTTASLLASTARCYAPKPLSPDGASSPRNALRKLRSSLSLPSSSSSSSRFGPLAVDNDHPWSSSGGTPLRPSGRNVYHSGLYGGGQSLSLPPSVGRSRTTPPANARVNDAPSRRDPRSASMQFVKTRELKRVLIEELRYTRKEVQQMSAQRAADIVAQNRSARPLPPSSRISRSARPSRFSSVRPSTAPRARQRRFETRLEGPAYAYSEARPEDFSPAPPAPRSDDSSDGTENTVLPLLPVASTSRVLDASAIGGTIEFDVRRRR